MKKFNQFIKEDLRNVGYSENYTSNVFAGSKKDILKKSVNGKYHDLEIKSHEMMKKKPNMFCKILKNSKDSLLVEQLDTVNFLKDYKSCLSLLNCLMNVYEGETSEYYYVIKECLTSKYHDNKRDYNDIKNQLKKYDLNEKKFYNDIVDCEKNCNSENDEERALYIKDKILSKVKDFDKLFNFIKTLIYLKLDIFDYFEDFIGDDDSIIWTDLHRGNFGYRKGTKQIICLDPIAINVKRLNK